MPKEFDNFKNEKIKVNKLSNSSNYYRTLTKQIYTLAYPKDFQLINNLVKIYNYCF